MLAPNTQLASFQLTYIRRTLGLATRAMTSSSGVPL